MQDDRFTTRLGFAVVAALAVGGVLVTQTSGLSLTRQLSVTAYFGHNAGLQEGADVQVAGRSIGTIDSIALASGRDPADVGVVMTIRLEARHAHRVPFNGEWFVNSKGIFGERYLEVGPPPGNGPWERVIRDGDRVRGVDPAQIDRLAAMSLQNITSMRYLTRELLPEWRRLARELDELTRTLDTISPAPDAVANMWSRQQGLVREGRTLAQTVADTGLGALGPTPIADVGKRASALLAHARKEISTLRTRLATVTDELYRVRDQLDSARFEQFQQLSTRVDSLLARAEQTIAIAQEIAEFVEAGRGTVGGLIHDTEIADFAKLMNKHMKRRPWELVGTQRPQ